MNGLAQGIHTNAIHFILAEYNYTTLVEAFFDAITPEMRRASLSLLKEIEAADATPVIVHRRRR